MTDNYEDIIALPHPEPKRHKRMAMADRAAQFAPFAAVTEHKNVVKETARRAQKALETEYTGDEWEGC